MAKVHIVVDYTYLYYKYTFQLDSGRMKRLTYIISENGEDLQKDISQIYYSIKEIESFRKKLEDDGHDVYVSICFDEKTGRKDSDSGINAEVAEKYKSNRTKRLSDEDYENMIIVQNLLDKAGYNTYRIEQLEADDVIYNLLKKYKDKFDRNIIYTPDADLISNVCSNVEVCRYKASKGYSSINMDNFTEYLSTEMKCNIPYNSLGLYKVTVGDKSDCVDGIKKFGPKAFDKLVDFLDENGLIWENAGNNKAIENILKYLLEKKYFNETQYKQAIDSLSVVEPMITDNIKEPVMKSSLELREKSYSTYGMKSLIK